MKEIRRLAVSDPTDGFSEEISRHYLFIDRLNSFNLSESIGFFLRTFLFIDQVNASRLRSTQSISETSNLLCTDRSCLKVVLSFHEESKLRERKKLD